MSNLHNGVPAFALAAGEATALGAMVLVVGAASAVAVGSATYLVVGALTGGRAFLRGVPVEIGFLLARRPPTVAAASVPPPALTVVPPLPDATPGDLAVAG
ncbi:hypothetical protein GB931_01985 [Modestobacter sp. I12A-02628]|uniref:Uncharacterized protein n=1 Tax=Goekera deserti TaxID=2497753 RepID=A0A7K3WI91_9ACTN|nr:hypothetical protein [Goekera deserti]MPQ96708.1 hypothetical protein [Goekera deserti]NDI46978.1 hypothetical protein [Goekera deserti]NEL56215.1 hypothetical protein [Goekera deserti]